MGIYKKGRIWWFIKQYQGKRVEGSLGTNNKRLAEQKFAKILTQIIDGSYFEHPREIPMMRSVIERYLKEVSQFQASHERNIDYAKHWCDFLGDRLVPEVTKSLLSTYKAKRLSGEIVYGKGKGRKVGESTVKKEFSFLRRVFNKAIDEWDDAWSGYFKDNTGNPARKVIKGLRETQRVRYVTSEEAQKLRFTLPKWIKPMVVVSAHTGLRLGNIVNLRINHVDFSRNCLNLPAMQMKNKKPMSIMMTSEVRATLELVIKANKSSTLVFSDENGNPYSSNAVSMAFRRACIKAKIKDLRFHDLRHDFATLLANEGASLYQIQMMLGHSDPRMTQRYAHLLPENLNVVKYIDGKGTTTILRQSDKKKRGYNA